MATTETKTTKIIEPGESNLSFILHSPYKVTLEQKLKPVLSPSSSANDVLLAVNYTGICGSDVHYWSEGRIGSFALTNPMILGHESSGTVIACGLSVRHLKPGDRVAIEPGSPCRKCPDCLGGKYNLCADMKFAATPPYDGTLTGFVTMPSDFCYKLPDHVSLQEGALIEPLAVAVHMVRQAVVKPGQSVVVMGAGPVGLLCCVVAKAFGASKVVAVDIQPSRLEFAAKYAAAHTFTPEKVASEANASRLIKEAELGDGADVVIDASGAEPSIQCSIYALRRGGTYVQGGMGKPDVQFPILIMCVKELTVKGSFRYSSGDYKLAVEFVGSGKVDVKTLISREVKFEDAEEAFMDVKEGKGIKILIRGPNEG